MTVAVFAGQRYLGALTCSSGHKCLLLGGTGGGQALHLSPNVDPVQMAISFGRWNGSQQQVLAITPGGSVILFLCQVCGVPSYGVSYLSGLQISFWLRGVR